MKKFNIINDAVDYYFGRYCKGWGCQLVVSGNKSIGYAEPLDNLRNQYPNGIFVETINGNYWLWKTEKKDKHFHPSSFYWDLTAIHSTKKQIQDVCNILNALTPEQIKAVELYGSSRYQEGFGDGLGDDY